MLIHETQEELLHRIGKKYLNTSMRDTGYGATGLTGIVVKYELGARMHGVWLTIDLGENIDEQSRKNINLTDGRFAKQYRRVR